MNIFGKTIFACTILIFSVSENLYAQQTQFRAIAIPAPAELKAGHEGTVRVLVTINVDGSVASATTERVVAGLNWRLPHLNRLRRVNFNLPLTRMGKLLHLPA